MAKHDAKTWLNNPLLVSSQHYSPFAVYVFFARFSYFASIGCLSWQPFTRFGHIWPRPKPSISASPSRVRTLNIHKICRLNTKCLRHLENSSIDRLRDLQVWPKSLTTSIVISSGQCAMIRILRFAPKGGHAQPNLRNWNHYHKNVHREFPNHRALNRTREPGSESNRTHWKLWYAFWATNS